MPEQQTYATHRRFHWPYHFVTIPILSINVLVALYMVFRHPSIWSGWNVLVAIALALTALWARFYGLRNQDRMIRLEERLRLATVLPEDLRRRISELHMSDLIALRFCSDEELPEITRRVLAGELKGRDAIKREVKNWRPDYHRL
ncbi:MAG: DUF6526 family protein [Thermoanaerobaculia bacterium]